MSERIFKSEEGRRALLDFYDRMVGSWNLPLEEIDVKTLTGRTHVLAAGNIGNPPLVLLHGSTSNAATWLPDFGIYMKDFRVYAPDMPGEPGKSSETRMSWKNNEYSEWLLDVLDRLNLEKPCFVGISLGGWVALRFAAIYPERAGKLALVSPGGIVSPRMRAVLRLVRYQNQGRKGVEKTIRLLFPEDFDSPEVTEFFMLLGQHFNSRKEAVPIIGDREISEIQSDVLILCGSNDVFFNFKKAEKRFSGLLPASEIRMYEGGRHGMVSMAGTILPFLNSVRSAGQ